MPIPEYFEGSRPEIADLVPRSCEKILDVGCGYGGLGRALKQRGFSQLFGIEINPEAAPKLAETYLEYWIEDVERLDLPRHAEFFDCIVFADVLEHLRDPWGALQRYLKLLKSGGTVVASIPNVRNIALLYNLVVRGKWEYEDYGLLDRTHLRFFTRDSISELLTQQGLVIEHWQMNRDRYSGVRQLVARVAKVFVNEIDVCQYIVVARKP